MSNNIMLDLKVDHVNKLCKICETIPGGVNVFCGRRCVDGTSVMGLMGMVGHIVQLCPVTLDEDEFRMFYYNVKQLGAYFEEDFIR